MVLVIWTLMEMLMNYEWKGNIRELQNVIERAIIFAESDHITAADIGLMGSSSVQLDEERESLNQAMKVYEREHIIRILNRHNGSKSEAAKALGIGVSSLYRKIDELNIDSTKTRD